MKMKTRTLPPWFALAGIVAALGCGGGSDVAEQERFQLERSPEVAAADAIRSEVRALSEALTEEGGSGFSDAVLYAGENFDAISVDALSDEDKAKAQQIKSMANELAGGGKAGAQEKIQQMQDLADQLPKEGGGGTE